VTTQVIRAGSTVRVVVQGRSIVGTAIDASGHLIVTYSDGATDNAGYIVGGTPPLATIANTRSDSILVGSAVSGFMTAAQAVVDLINAQGS
jgi:hypothetical protein